MRRSGGGLFAISDAEDLLAQPPMKMSRITPVAMTAELPRPASEEMAPGAAYAVMRNVAE